MYGLAYRKHVLTSYSKHNDSEFDYVDGKQIETWPKDNINQFAQSCLEGKLPDITVKNLEIYSQQDAIDKLKNMSVEERKRLRIRKNTLWYIQQNLKKGKQVKVYSKVKDKLDRK